MIRPKSKDVELNKYCDYLEAQIEEFKTHTKKKFYRGIQRQMDLISEEMLNPDFKVSLSAEGDEFNNFFDMLSKGKAIVDAMQNFENQAIPVEKTGTSELRADATAEKYIFKKD